MVMITNTEDSGGMFQVVFHIVTTERSYNAITDSVFLMPGESHQFEWTVNSTRFLNCSYEVLRPSKFQYVVTYLPKERTVTKYHEVAKQRTVTKYHDVAKERTITKYKNVIKYKYISAFEYLTQE